MTIPSFFIIGAPKCGTTALSLYLAEHPDVMFSDPKEPKYFHTDFGERHRTTLTPEEYNRCFSWDRTKPPQAIGEGTVWYLYSREAVPNVLRAKPDAKFIVMVRNPVDLVYSLHSQFVYGGYEDIEDFELAWRSQEERRHAVELPRLCPDRKLLLYGEVAALGSQLERLFRIVDVAKVHVVIFDDFVQDPERTYRRILTFLQLDADGRKSFETINANKVVTSRPAARAMFRLGAIKRSLGLRRSLGIWRALSPYFTAPASRRELDPRLKDELTNHFRGEVARLSRLLNRDLTMWSR